MDFPKTFPNNFYFWLGIFVLIMFFSIQKERQIHEVVSWRFKGAVQKIWYDEKDIPTIVVKGRTYPLVNTFWDFNIKIHEGDTVIKYRGDRRIKVIFRNSKDTVFFNGN